MCPPRARTISLNSECFCVGISAKDRGDSKRTDPADEDVLGGMLSEAFDESLDAFVVLAVANHKT